MTLAIFDLDNTLIAGDSDHSWGEFIVEKGLVDGDEYRRKNDQFFQDYSNGTLDIHAYLAFVLGELTRFSSTELQDLREEFMATKIDALMQPKSFELIASHRSRGHIPLIITATNRFVTEPIAAHLGIEHLLASEAEIINGRYTGKSRGIACFQEGKVKRLKSWMADHGYTLEGSYFYSDSANDIPLLEYVENPVAVDPCPRLHSYALEQDIPIISLRE